jgi:hypothetical protein
MFLERLGVAFCQTGVFLSGDEESERKGDS